MLNRVMCIYICAYTNYVQTINMCTYYISLISLRLSFMVRVASVQSEVIKGTSLHLFLHKILQKYVCDI